MWCISSYKQFARPVFTLALVSISSLAFALSLSDLSNQDASAGLKAVLEKGSTAAVSKLGVENGFMNNEKVKIKLPAKFDKARALLQMTGQSKKFDELELSMNRAAEAAVPMAKPLLVDAIKSMTVTDAKNILTGGDTSVTDFFRQKRCPQLGCRTTPGDLLCRQEQKLVDTMITADLIHFAKIGQHDLAVVSSDDDVWPGIQTALLYGARVTQVHTRQGQETRECYTKGLKQYKFTSL